MLHVQRTGTWILKPISKVNNVRASSYAEMKCILDDCPDARSSYNDKRGMSPSWLSPISAVHP